MSKTTPAPWIAVKRRGTWVVENDKGYLVADTKFGDTTGYANAQLISTTPDILHLLSTALPFVEDHEGSTVYKAGAVAALVKDIKAAIAKAEA